MASARGARPQAAAQLPSLANGAVRMATPIPATSPMAVVTTAASFKPHSVSFDPSGQPDSEAVLPPRQTGRMPAMRDEGTPWYKSWPILVIVLASIAIIAAIVLLVIPDNKRDDGHLVDPPGPAPDRMNTNPLPDHSSVTPDPNDPNKPDPLAQGSAATPDPTPSRPPPPTSVPPPDDDDILGGILGGTAGGGTPQAGRHNPFDDLAKLTVQATPVLLGVMTHACARMKTCGGDDMMCDTYVAALSRMAKVKPPTCAAATKCFENVDAMSCDDVGAGNSDPLALVQPLMKTMQDCLDAIRC